MSRMQAKKGESHNTLNLFWYILVLSLLFNEYVDLVHGLSEIS